MYNPLRQLKSRPWLHALLGVGVVLLLAVVTWSRLSHTTYPSSVSQGNSSRDRYHRRFAVFGTVGDVTLWGQEQRIQKAGEAIMTRLRALHNRINLFDSDSELSRLNRKASRGGFRCSDRMWQLLQVAKRAYEETDGAVDVTVGPLMELWGFHEEQEEIPEEDKIHQVLKAVGFAQVELDSDGQRVKFQNSDTYVDFGGLAKGYALDVAVKIARKKGIQRGLINLGGNIACLSKPPPGQCAYRIGIRDPVHPDQLLMKIHVTDCFISSSGNYEKSRKIGGRRIGHIVDPRTGEPVQDIAGTTVVANKGITSDIYSTAVFIDGESRAKEFTERHKNPAGVLLVRRKKGAEESVVQKIEWQWADQTQ